MMQVLSWLCLLLGWGEGEGVCACCGFFDRVRCAVGVDEDGVAYLLNDGAAAWRMRGPAGAAGMWSGSMAWLGKIQSVYSASGSLGVLLSLIQSIAAKTTRG